MAKLNTYVHVTRPDGGPPVRFGPDDQVPDWAIEQISNPDVWEGDQPKGAGSAASADSAKGTAKSAADAINDALKQAERRAAEAEKRAEAAEAELAQLREAGGGQEQEIKEPPRGGPGSSAEAWTKFASEQGITVPDGTTARDVQALWDEHKAKQG